MTATDMPNGNPERNTRPITIQRTDRADYCRLPPCPERIGPHQKHCKEAENITASRINKRLPVKNEKDELGELSLTFNALLDRLEKSFNSQKMFCQQRVARTAYPYGCTFCRT